MNKEVSYEFNKLIHTDVIREYAKNSSDWLDLLEAVYELESLDNIDEKYSKLIEEAKSEMNV